MGYKIPEEPVLDIKKFLEFLETNYTDTTNFGVRSVSCDCPITVWVMLQGFDGVRTSTVSIYINVGTDTQQGVPLPDEIRKLVLAIDDSGIENTPIAVGELKTLIKNIIGDK